GERNRRELSAFAHATGHVVPWPFCATLRRGHRAGGCHAGGGRKRGSSSSGVGTRRGTARNFADGIPLGRVATSAGGASPRAPSFRTKGLARSAATRAAEPFERVSGGGAAPRFRVECATVDAGGAVPHWRRETHPRLELSPPAARCPRHSRAADRSFQFLRGVLPWTRSGIAAAAGLSRLHPMAAETRLVSRRNVLERTIERLCHAHAARHLAKRGPGAGPAPGAQR